MNEYIHVSSVSVVYKPQGEWFNSWLHQVLSGRCPTNTSPRGSTNYAIIIIILHTEDAVVLAAGFC